jgi:hypothetical protein
MKEGSQARSLIQREIEFGSGFAGNNSRLVSEQEWSLVECRE